MNLKGAILSTILTFLIIGFCWLIIFHDTIVMYLVITLTILGLWIGLYNITKSNKNDKNKDVYGW